MTAIGMPNWKGKARKASTLHKELRQPRKAKSRRNSLPQGKSTSYGHQYKKIISENIHKNDIRKAV